MTRARDVDWAAFAAALGDVEVVTDAGAVKKKSQDFYWYSPILKEQLAGCVGDMVVLPRSEAEVIAVAGACARPRVPLTVRGAGTGNYGQAMPLAGGVILDTTRMDRIRWLEGGVLCVEPGLKMNDLEARTRPQGWELRTYPSTRRTATIGGYVAGGSGGVGSITYGLLLDRGAINRLRVVTCEEAPRIVELVGDDVLKAGHAYGTNGVITEIELPMAPAMVWHELMVTFDDFMAACGFCQALGECPTIVKKLVTAVAWPIPQYFTQLRRYLPDGRHLVILMIAESSLVAARGLVAEHGGVEVYAKSEADVAADRSLPLYEYTWNHTTLQALKADKTITYLQSMFAPPDHLAKIHHMIETFGDEVPMHVEFANLGGRVGGLALQLVRYTTPARLDEIIAYHEANGVPIFNPHTYVLEDGGMKQVDHNQLDFKRAADPYGLMNPGKMRGWGDGR